ncbi:MAG: PhoH family protein [Myxococcota bacterium]|nr:PhoH family protein [Myxococcota bacterium]MEC8380677.1 PhoH family protein [Myxococcota bacterium]
MLRELIGALGKNAKVIARVLEIELHHNGDRLIIRGDKDKLERAIPALQQLHSVYASGVRLTPAEIEQNCTMLLEEPDVNLMELSQEVIFTGARQQKIAPRSIRQRSYFHAIQKHDLVFGIGPAGTGKTFLAMAMALDALVNQRVKRIILCRPAVEAGEKLGFLPGDLVEKVNPYLRPLYDAMFELAGREKSERMLERGIIEVAPLAFMRGRTLSQAFVILDEAQNTTPEQMKMFLTRIGMGSKAVVTGDPSQVDLPRNQKSGLNDALWVLRNVSEISVVRLTSSDVVRHPLVSAIIRAYDRVPRDDK